MTRRADEGTIFALPLDSGHAVGVLSRKRGSIGFGFFFAPLSDDELSAFDLAALVPTDAILVSRFTLGAIRSGDWPIIGQIPRWDRDAWRIPVLQRYDHLLRQHVLVEYGDDPSESVGTIPADPFQSVATKPSDDLIGDGGLARRIERALHA